MRVARTNPRLGWRPSSVALSAALLVGAACSGAPGAGPAAQLAGSGDPASPSAGATTDVTPFATDAAPAQADGSAAGPPPDLPDIPPSAAESPPPAPTQEGTPESSADPPSESATGEIPVASPVEAEAKSPPPPSPQAVEPEATAQAVTEPAPSLPAPVQPEVRSPAPVWEPATILISKDGVDEIIPVYDAPDGNRLTFPDGEVWSYTYRRNRLVVRVTQGERGDEWVEAELPIRPNGVRGWIRTDKFDWSTVNHHILIDISDRHLVLYDGDEVVTQSRVIVGKPSTPTPLLSGFIVEKLPNHNQEHFSVVVGDWVLMLSFFSEALNSFGGGLPRIAIKGTHIPERVGEALSNGGARVPNQILEVVAWEAPLGTAVNVVP